MKTSATILSAILVVTGSSSAIAQQASARTGIDTAPGSSAATREFSEPDPQSRRDVELEYRLESRFGTIRGLDVSNVTMRIIRGAVTLAGSVPSRQVHDQLLGAVANTEGVLVLRDETVIAPPSRRGGGPADDARVAATVRNVLFDDRSVVGDHLGIEVRSGVATIGGTVRNYTDARHIVRRVRGVPGVKAVHSNLRIDDAPAMEDDPRSAF